MCVLSTFSDPRAGRCPGCPRGENGTLPAACPDPSSVHRPAKRTLPCQFAPRAAFLTAPSARGPLRRTFPFSVSLPCSLSSLPRHCHAVHSLSPHRLRPVPPSRSPVSFPLVPAPPRLPVFRFLATFSPVRARPSRRVSLLFVFLPLTFFLPPRKQRFPAAPAAGGYHGETHREGRKNKDPLPPRRQGDFGNVP